MQTCENITDDDVTLTFGKTMRRKSLNWCSSSDFQLMPTTVYCDMPAGLLVYTSLARLALTHIENDLDAHHCLLYQDMSAGLLAPVYTSLARLALTHIENDLDDLHGRVCHCGGCHGAVGQALQWKARRKGRVCLYSCSIPAYSYNV